MKTYKFESYDEDSNVKTVVEFDTESDMWSGYEGPMYNFFNFLKGSGFVFDLEDSIGIMQGNGDFKAAAEG
jgi:hypothetical protein